jgi:hypothetical protein
MTWLRVRFATGTEIVCRHDVRTRSGPVCRVQAHWLRREDSHCVWGCAVQESRSLYSLAVTTFWPLQARLFLCRRRSNYLWISTQDTTRKCWTDFHEISERGNLLTFVDTSGLLFGKILWIVQLKIHAHFWAQLEDGAHNYLKEICRGERNIGFSSLHFFSSSYTIRDYWLTYLLNLLTYLLTYSKKQSHSWETNRFSASQEIPRILWNP